VEHKDVSDRQLEAVLARLDAIQEELARINRRLEANEGFIQVTRELRNLNESLNAIAYAALGQSPQVRRRRAG
jgi:Ni,Fe-hydrogenase III large subunit